MPPQESVRHRLGNLRLGQHNLGTVLLGQGLHFLFHCDGFGATPTVLTTGASAPLVQMQAPAIRDRVNACYGYNAIARITITQTAPTGFADGQVAFAPAPRREPPPPDPATTETARGLALGVGDDGLRAALEALGEKVLSRSGKQKG